MATKSIKRIEFGDFQTPDRLAEQVCGLLRRDRVSPRTIVEPTCGSGSFLRACVDEFPECTRILGFEVNPDHVENARAVPRAEVHQEDFFRMDWPRTLNGLDELILVIGNPPWVTNSAVGSIAGENLPAKSNFQNLRGFDAITGKSNFDISEWMLLCLLGALSGRRAVVAMLCKTVVARKVLCHVWKHNFQVLKSKMFSIDANEHFGAAVDACLLVCHLEPGRASMDCQTYRDLAEDSGSSTIGLRDGRLVADLSAFSDYGYLAGQSQLKWRSGVKHDCANVLELRHKGNDIYENKLGETVKLEADYLYPMLKGSELARRDALPSKVMLVVQRSTGEDTSKIQRIAPMTWEYLVSHEHFFERRASSIYKNRPRFSIFGIGPYSFSSWKVAICGFYKRIEFRCIGPFSDKPIMVDDTCYFLPCQTEDDAVLLTRILNSTPAISFLKAFTFWDSKRPITAQLLQTLNLLKLADEVGVVLPKWVDPTIKQEQSVSLSLFRSPTS